MRSTGVTDSKFGSFSRGGVAIQTVTIDSAYSLASGKAPKVLLVQIAGLGHEAWSGCQRKILEFFKAVILPQLRSGKFRPRDKTDRLSPRLKNMRSESCRSAGKTPEKPKLAVGNARTPHIHSLRICSAF